VPLRSGEGEGLKGNAVRMSDMLPSEEEVKK
jgi:hypothetical protein